MNTHILQVVWPITDDTYTRAQLIDIATGDLDGLADQAHAIITGPAIWEIHPAADVPGWTAHAPGLVLIARAPADRYGPPAEHRRTNPTPDHAAVQRLIDGNPPAQVRRVDRAAAMAQMAGYAEVGAVAGRFGVDKRAVHQAVHRARQHDPAA